MSEEQSNRITAFLQESAPDAMCYFKLFDGKSSYAYTVMDFLDCVAMEAWDILDGDNMRLNGGHARPVAGMTSNDVSMIDNTAVALNNYLKKNGGNKDKTAIAYTETETKDMKELPFSLGHIAHHYRVRFVLQKVRLEDSLRSKVVWDQDRPKFTSNSDRLKWNVLKTDVPAMKKEITRCEEIASALTAIARRIRTIAEAPSEAIDVPQPMAKVAAMCLLPERKPQKVVNLATYRAAKFRRLHP